LQDVSGSLVAEGMFGNCHLWVFTLGDDKGMDIPGQHEVDFARLCSCLGFQWRHDAGSLKLVKQFQNVVGSLKPGAINF
jgi:hypothetical protein